LVGPDTGAAADATGASKAQTATEAIEIRTDARVEVLIPDILPTSTTTGHS
jgi:hypothetical protein